MKKILAIALSALLLMTVCASISASADGGVVVSVAKATGAAGEDVAVDFVVDSNSGIWGLSLDVAYDTSVLELKSVEFGSAFSSAMGFLPVDAGAETFTINAMANAFENVTATGTLATATFTVKAGAAEGAVADITVTFNENNQCDADMNNVPMTVNNGSVTVVAKAEPTTTAPAETTTTVAPTEPTKTPVTDAPSTTGTNASPDTGSALPIAAIVLAAGSAAVLTFARKK